MTVSILLPCAASPKLGRNEVKTKDKPQS